MQNNHLTAPQLLVLGLHRIGIPPAEATHRALFTSPALLRFNIRMLRKLGFNFVTLRDAMRSPSGKNAVVAFDDGYTDTFEVAKPVLDEFGIPATVFVVTGDMGKRGVVWEEAGEKLPADLMDWDMLGRLAEDGWEIGSHAHEHIHLDRYSIHRQEETILRSVAEIENRLGNRPSSFCYPYGAFNADTKSALKKAGLSHALSSRSARTTSMDQLDNFELPRVIVGGRNIDWYFKCAFRTLRTFELETLLPTWNEQLITLDLSPVER